MIVTKAPGKLFIAGEYSVTHPGNTGILVAVDRFITVYLERASNEGSISKSSDETISWKREDDKISLDRHNADFSYVLAAIKTVDRYAKDLGRDLSYYQLKIESELESEKGIKYGLGSSAAVTVATTKALCKYYHIELTEDSLFKLSALANILINKDGSCGDIAACAYGGWIAYSSFDRQWVLDKLNNTRISLLISLEWPGLKVEKLIPPKEMKFAIGWTGRPSSTTNLVAQVNKNRLNNSEIYNSFLDDSEECVEQIIKAFKDNNIDEIQIQIKRNRKILVKMGNDLGVEIETPHLKNLCEIALKYNGSAKSSGAGGGDCAIAIFKEGQEIGPLFQEWGQA